MSGEKPDVRNAQLVGAGPGDLISVIGPKSCMTPEEALRHAAWLVALAEPMVHEGAFKEILEAVRST